MVKLWTPQGNKKQTEIDIKLTSIVNYTSKLKIDLTVLRRQLIGIEEDTYELESCLDKLKNEALVVSASQFGLIRGKLNESIKQRDKILLFIKNTKATVADLSRQSEELIKLRSLSDTKIIHIDFGKK